MGEIPAHPNQAAGHTASGAARFAEISEHEQECVHTLDDEEDQHTYTLHREGMTFVDIATQLGCWDGVPVCTMFRRTQRRVTACMKRRLDGYAQFWDED